MGRFSENTRWYKAEIVFLTNEDEIRTESEMRELLRKLFNDNGYKFFGADIIENECTHDEWKRNATHLRDPDGWYYGNPCYEVEYICTKCGKKKYVKE